MIGFNADGDAAMSSGVSFIVAIYTSIYSALKRFKKSRIMSRKVLLTVTVTYHDPDDDLVEDVCGAPAQQLGSLGEPAA